MLLGTYSSAKRGSGVPTRTEWRSLAGPHPADSKAKSRVAIPPWLKMCSLALASTLDKSMYASPFQYFKYTP